MDENATFLSRVIAAAAAARPCFLYVFFTGKRINCPRGGAKQFLDGHTYLLPLALVFLMGFPQLEEKE